MDLTSDVSGSSSPPPSASSILKRPPSCSSSPGPNTSECSTPNPQSSSSYNTPKIVSKNANGTLVLTSQPNNEAEIQLYRVMQRASLLAYYDTLLEMGGDDVQQLCEAGEEEFLEIMALVGMASKPLHVRRLQKVLQEWLTNPSIFQSPLISPILPSNFLARGLPPFIGSLPAPNSSSLVNSMSSSPSINSSNFLPSSPPPVESTSSSISLPISSPGQTQSPGPRSGSPIQLTPVLVESQILKLADTAQKLAKALPHLEPKPQNNKKKVCKDLELVFKLSDDDPRRMELIRKYSAIYGRFDCKRKPEKPLTLHEVSVNEAAAQICSYVPALLTRRDELFPLARQVVRDSGYHYSKGHSKSTATSFLQNGDLNINNKRPKLEDQNEEHQQKIQRQDRLDQIGDELKLLSDRTDELLEHTKNKEQQTGLQHQVEILQSRRTSLLMEQKELIKQNNFQLARQLRRSSMSNNHTANQCFDSDRIDTDDTDSQVSFGNVSSPGTTQEVSDTQDNLRKNEIHSHLERIAHKKYSRQIGVEDSEYEMMSSTALCRYRNNGSFNHHDSFYQDNRFKVISSSGGNIIAVANPALSMSLLSSSTIQRDMHTSVQNTPMSSKEINC